MEKSANNQILGMSKVMFVLSIFAVSMLVLFSTPAVAGATYNHDDEPKKGSITVCKAIVDGEGNVVDGTGVAGAFELSGLDFNSPDGVLPTSQFSTPLVFNKNIFSGVEGDDVQCIKYDKLSLGDYYYGEEVITGDNWLAPKYNDQHTTAVNGLSDFFPYSGELFTIETSDDSSRNTNADGHIVLTKDRPSRTLIVLNEFEVKEIEYAPYCGDGILNQEWEQCDGGNQCTAQCQTGNQCVELALARVNVEETENWGGGNVTSDIFLGSLVDKIPQGVWFLLSQNGVPVVDTDMTSGGYENVPGISVERQDGSVRTLVHGSLSQANGINKEHVDGNLEFWGATVTGQTSDDSGNNKLENGFDGNVSLSAGQDEVWLESGNTLQSFFWLTVTTADDGFFTAYGDTPECSVNIVGTKVMCESEELLPNWGGGNVVSQITETTATDYVEQTKGCWLEKDWMFQYGDQSVSNPGDQVGEAGGDWTTFGPTNNGGVAEVSIADVTDISRLWVREVFQSGFVPFTHATTKSDVSAEMYCDKDVLNYDNYDYISNPIAGNTYYCVAFNAPEEIVEPPVCDPQVNLIKNGGFETPELSSNTWDVFYSGHSLLEWMTGDNGVEIQNNVAGAPYAGEQHAELDPHNVTSIWQEVATEPGYTYRFNTQYSPRPGRTLEDVRFEFLLNGSTLGDSVARTGEGNVDTDWTFEERLFVATDASTTVGFVETGLDTSYGAYLDEVGLYCEPNPPVVNEKPVITLHGNATVILTVGDTYAEDMADVDDAEDGDIDSKLVIGGATVNTNIAGIYVVTYNATDSLDLAADEVTREVKVNNPIPDPKQCEDGDDNDGDNLIDVADPGCHSDGNPDNPDSYEPKDDDETHTPPYANYCGDGVVNQTWESCDGTDGVDGAEQCTAQCQFANQCIEMSFARVNVNLFENHSNGDISDDIFLGSAINKIPMGAWFLLYDTGTYVSDSNADGYEDVPGLAVERQEGSVRVVAYGSHGNDGSKEHINGDVEFFNFEVTEPTSDNSGNNKLEGEVPNAMGSMDDMPGDDEVWLKAGNDTQSFFWLTTTTADDAFFGNYGDEVPMCTQPNTPPTITLDLPNPQIIPLFGTYNLLGATATDTEDDDVTLTSAIVVGGDIVDPNTVGTYFVTYDVTDSGGLDAETATRTVSVVDDSEPTECNDGDLDNDEDGTADETDVGCWTDPEDPQTYDPNDDDENAKPVITRTNDNVRITIGTPYTDEGATADDSEDGDITNDIVTTGTTTVDVNTPGLYTIRYNVTDSDGAAADEVTRTVEVYNPGSNPVCTSNCGGGGGGGPVPNNLKIFNERITVIGEGTALITWETNKPADSRVVYDDDAHVLDVSTLNFGTGSDDLGYEFTTDTVSALTLEHSMLVTNVNLEDLFYFRPLSTDGTRAIGIELSAVLGVVTGGTCEQYLFEFIRFGANNNPSEVRKLQIFLNDLEGNDLQVTGIYDVPTFEAVEAFQNKYSGDVLSPWGLQGDTGYVYLTTRKKINEIYCNFKLPFPLSVEQLAEVNAFKLLLAQLEADGLPLPDTSNVGFAPTAPTFAGGNNPNTSLTEEGALAQNGGEGDDSLAAAISAVEGNGRGLFSRIGNFLKGLFR